MSLNFSALLYLNLASPSPWRTEGLLKIGIFVSLPLLKLKHCMLKTISDPGFGIISFSECWSPSGGRDKRGQDSVSWMTLLHGTGMLPLSCALCVQWWEEEEHQSIQLSEYKQALSSFLFLLLNLVCVKPSWWLLFLLCFEVDQLVCCWVKARGLVA